MRKSKAAACMHVRLYPFAFYPRGRCDRLAVKIALVIIFQCPQPREKLRSLTLTNFVLCNRYITDLSSPTRSIYFGHVQAPLFLTALSRVWLLLGTLVTCQKACDYSWSKLFFLTSVDTWWRKNIASGTHLRVGLAIVENENRSSQPFPS